MRKTGLTLLIIISVLCLKTSFVFSQGADFGIDAGVTGFLGDLGGANFVGRPGFFDLEGSLMKPAVSIHYRYYLSSRFAIKGTFTYTAVAGDDKLIQPTQEFAPEWYRYYRNLNFQSTIVEGALTFEVNLARFEPGYLRYRFAPYVFGGIGFFHFNPTTIYNGQVVQLKPLRTEGEGFQGTGVKEYSLLQPVFPLGVGIRYSVSNMIILGFEYATHITLTDYIDDVSQKYVSQDAFNVFFANDPATAALAYDLSVRSDEIDPGGINASVTAPGQERGDTKRKDSYLIAQISISLVIGAKAGYTNQLGKYRRLQKKYLHH